MPPRVRSGRTLTVRSYLTIDPVGSLNKYSGPVVVMNGEKDVQIRANVEAPLLMAALKKRAGGEKPLFIVPGASHNLKLVSSDRDPGFTGPAAPAALDKLSEWLESKLSG